VGVGLACALHGKKGLIKGGFEMEVLGNGTGGLDGVLTVTPMGLVSEKR
jgi:hypothetical protein